MTPADALSAGPRFFGHIDRATFDLRTSPRNYSASRSVLHLTFTGHRVSSFYCGIGTWVPREQPALDRARGLLGSMLCSVLVD